MDTENYDENGNTDDRRLDRDAVTGGRSLTTDYGLDRNGYPVEPPAPRFDQGGEDR